MTRETKVGLIVAGSFLCLVGVVVASRWRRQADASQPVAQSIAPKHQDGEKENKKPAVEPKTNPSGVAQAEFKAPGMTPPPLAKSGLDTPGLDKQLPLPTLPPADNFKPALTNNTISFPPPPTPPLLDAAAAKVEAAKTAIDDNQKKTLAELKKNTDAASDLAAAILPGKPVDTPPPPVPPSGLDLFSAPPPPGPLALDKKNDPAPLPAPKPPAGPPVPDMVTVPKIPTSPLPGDPSASITVVKPPQSGDGNKTSSPSLTSVGPDPLPKPEPTGNVLVGPKQDFAFPSPPAPPFADVKPKLPEGPAAPPAPIAFNKELTNPNMPPLGSEAKNPLPPVTIPPVSLKPSNPSMPQVKSFTPETYFCKPEDTSFEAISSRYYGTPNYGRALLQYNRDHPLAKDNIRQDNPRLQQGQAVFVPPKDFLDARFSTLVDNRPSAPTPPAISIRPPVNSSVPATPLTGPTVGGVPTPAPSGSNDPTKAYRVPPQGQMLAEIAQQTLGDHRRWSEIYRLNYTLRPEQPVPGGTEIRLPLSANVP